MEEKSTKQGSLFVVTGPSGSGKTTLCHEAVNRTQASLSVSATTRRPGKNETHGEDYYFLSHDDFNKYIQNNCFLEHAKVFDNFYGTLREPVEEKLKKNETIILEIDVQGAKQVFSNHPEAIGILILPPSHVELRRRLENRARDSKQTIEQRIEKANWEIQQAQADEHFKHTITNDNFERAVQELIDIIE